jgi:phosphatidate cytidylyltransferase
MKYIFKSVTTSPMKTISLALAILVWIGHVAEANIVSQSELINFHLVTKSSSSTSYSSGVVDNNNEKELHRTLDTKINFSSFFIRTVSALFAFSLLSTIIKFFGNDGIKAIILASQIGLFSEAMNVASVKDGCQWWVLLTNMIYWDTQHIFSNCQDLRAVNFICFGMLILHIITMILEQNRLNSYSESLRSFCLSYTAGAILVGMSSSWLMIMHSFRSKWVFYPVLLVIVNDTMAYVCGMKFGKYRILPNISPNKTWEGFIGAAVCTLAICKPLAIWIGINSNDASSMHLYIIGLYISFVAPFGGFLASSVKRNFGHKDFGTILPGHGGLIDRMDCHLLTAPFILHFLKNIDAYRLA